MTGALDTYLSCGENVRLMPVCAGNTVNCVPTVVIDTARTIGTVSRVRTLEKAGSKIGNLPNQYLRQSSDDTGTQQTQTKEPRDAIDYVLRLRVPMPALLSGITIPLADQLRIILLWIYHAH